jgi:hypothetical protein
VLQHQVSLLAAADTAQPFKNVVVVVYPLFNFAQVLNKQGVTDLFIRNWLSLLCFLLQGQTSEGTLTAVMAYMVSTI